MKGFTLTELLGVIIILGVIALITYPVVDNTIKNNKEKLYNSQLEEIKLAAEKWAYANLSLLPTNENESITVTLLELKKAGYVPIDSRNPKTGELLPNDMVITITFKNNNYDIYVDGESGSDLSNEFNENAPTIILNGNYIEYVEINSFYVDKGAQAISKDGSEVEVNITYQENGSEIGNIDVTKFSTYTVIYSATSNGYTSRITRTVVVRDTTPPDLIVPSTVTLKEAEFSSFDLLSGVSVTDNSGETINVETRGFDRLPTDKIIEYKACDSHNNCTIKRRIVKVFREDVDAPSLPNSLSFAEDSWETIAAIVKAGKATEFYNVGDTKEVTLTGTYAGTYTVRIANNSTPTECSTEGFSQTACGFVVEFVDIITNHVMNSTSTNSGGWPASKMYSFVNTDIYNTLPSDLQNVIIETYSVSGHGSNESSNIVSEKDKLYLLSTKEVWGKDGTSNTINFDSAEAETRQLDYYKNNGVTTDSYSGAVKTYQGSAKYWWLRAADSYDSMGFYYVNHSGGFDFLTAYSSYGVAPAFRIG